MWKQVSTWQEEWPYDPVNPPHQPRVPSLRQLHWMPVTVNSSTLLLVELQLTACSGRRVETAEHITDINHSLLRKFGWDIGLRIILYVFPIMLCQ